MQEQTVRHARTQPRRKNARTKGKNRKNRKTKQVVQAEEKQYGGDIVITKPDVKRKNKP